MGGSAENVTTHIKEHYREGMSLVDALRLAVDALGWSEAGARAIPITALEAAVLDRTRTRQRKFRRLTVADLERDPRERTRSPLGSGAAAPAAGGDTDEPPVAPPG